MVTQVYPKHPFTFSPIFHVRANAYSAPKNMCVGVCTDLFCMFDSCLCICEEFVYNPVELYFLADESTLIPKPLSNNRIALQC